MAHDICDFLFITLPNPASFLNKMPDISKIISDIHKEKGAGTENKVRSALNLLEERGGISGFIRSDKLDRKGVDFEVIIGRKNYKLSVKSSEGGVRGERERHPERFRHDDTIFIVPDRRESMEDLASRIMSEIHELEERMHEPHF